MVQSTIESPSGDALKIRLEADGAAGHRGEYATLALMAGSDRILEIVEGPLPLVIETAASADHQQIVVIQGSSASKNRGATDRSTDNFHGGYVLSAENAGTLPILDPLDDVEP